MAARLGLQLEHRSKGDIAARGSAALVRRAVEIAGGIEDQAGERSEPIGAIVVEAMQNPLLPASACLGHQLEHGAADVSAARHGRTIEIAGGVEDQAAVRSVPVHARGGIETVQNLLSPAAADCGRQLEYRTAAIRSAGCRRAVKIADGIEDQAGVGDFTVVD